MLIQLVKRTMRYHKLSESCDNSTRPKGMAASQSSRPELRKHPHNSECLWGDPLPDYWAETQILSSDVACSHQIPVSHPLTRFIAILGYASLGTDLTVVL